MFFRLSYTLKSLSLNNENSAVFFFNSKGNKIKIELILIPKDELTGGMLPDDMMCTATIEKKVSAKQNALFEAMNDITPSGLKETIRETTNELSNAIKTSIKVFRWKRGLASLYDFIRYGGVLAYSFDGKNWKSYASAVALTVTFDVAFQTLRPTDIEECNKLLENNILEPLGQELFSEAWSQRKNSPRSSLVIGIAAAETGFKESVIKLMPQASWLIANIQSPPLTKMLTDYLPLFEPKIKIKGKVLSPPTKIIEMIIKGVNLRNDIAHGRAKEIKVDTLEEILRAVRDVLYLLDFYSGNEWAFRLISYETTKALLDQSEKS